MTARVLRVVSVEDHFKRPANSVVSFGDLQVVAQKVDGEGGLVPRYRVGDLVVFVSDASIVPEYLLRRGFWDDAEDKGGLRGPKGDRVKAGKFAEVFSHGIHFPVTVDADGTATIHGPEGSEPLVVREGDDVSAYLGVTEWQG